jgi:phycocyanobilin lyase alpha subunit
MELMEPLSEHQVIANLQQREDASDRYYAAWWLGKMRSQHPEAVPLLLDTLSALDNNPVDDEERGVALNAIRALGLLLNPTASAPLIRLLSSKDYTVREEAARSLGAMQTQAALPKMCQLLRSGPTESGREQLGSSTLQEPCEALLEALGNIGVNTPDVLSVITPFSSHPRPLVRAAACRALLQLMKEQRWAVELEKLLQHPEPLVRRGVLLDLGATGWSAALPAIESASVEASLKLVALRGLAEQCDDTQVLDAMDRLL